jgi:hypothetical protein
VTFTAQASATARHSDKFGRPNCATLRESCGHPAPAACGSRAESRRLPAKVWCVSVIEFVPERTPLWLTRRIARFVSRSPGFSRNTGTNGNGKQRAEIDDFAMLSLARLPISPPGSRTPRSIPQTIAQRPSRPTASASEQLASVRLILGRQRPNQPGEDRQIDL